MPTSEAAILERIIEFEQGELPPEAARFFLSWDFPETDRQRLEELYAKACAGTLTSAERGDLENYRHVSQLLERMRSRARDVLAAASSGALLPHRSIEIPLGIRRSQEAFWRDLPELLQKKNNHGKWVCYHGDERVGIASTPQPLIRECLRRALKRDAYDLDVIEPKALPPWEPEDVAPLNSWHFEDNPREA